VKVDQAEAEQELHRHELQAYAIDAYVYGEPPQQVDVHVDPNGVVVDPRNSYLHAASVNRQQLIDSLRTAEDNLKTQLAVLDQSKQAATKQADDLKQRQDDAQQAADHLQDVKSHVDGELATLVQQAQEAQAQAEREAAQRAAEQAASGSPNSDPSSGPSSSPSPPSSSSDPADNPPGTIYIPTRPVPPGPAPDPDTEGAKKAIEFAKAQLGKPYVWGAAGPDAYDCSGLTMQAWKAGGVTMDHWTGSQYAQSRPISLTEVQPGDLIFYNQMQHVALYLGDGKIIHAPHTGATVQIEDMYYWRTTMAATRPGVGT
jgi:cell wall-associated NlpC family hydrolase